MGLRSSNTTSVSRHRNHPIRQHFPVRGLAPHARAPLFPIPCFHVLHRPAFPGLFVEYARPRIPLHYPANPRFERTPLSTMWRFGLLILATTSQSSVLEPRTFPSPPCQYARARVQLHYPANPRFERTPLSTMWRFALLTLATTSQSSVLEPRTFPRDSHASRTHPRPRSRDQRDPPIHRQHPQPLHHPQRGQAG